MTACCDLSETGYVEGHNILIEHRGRGQVQVIPILRPKRKQCVFPPCS